MFAFIKTLLNCGETSKQRKSYTVSEKNLQSRLRMDSEAWKQRIHEPIIAMEILNYELICD